MNPGVELVSTGSELLSGRTVNRHANTLGELLRPVGLVVVRDTTVGDDLDSIEEAIRGALDRTDRVFVSGGLGPTSDDMTRDAIARLLGRDVVMDDGAMQAMVERYAEFGRKVSKESERQALVVEGADVLLNPVGIAPGERLDLDGKTLFILPGPPGEFRGVLETHIIPWLRDNVPGARPVEERILMVSGIGESDVAAAFESAGFPGEGIDIGYCASPGRVEVRIGGTPEDAERLDAEAARAQELLGDHIYAAERIEIEEVVLRRLSRSARFLATAEFGTDGLLAQRMSLSPSSAGTFLGGIVIHNLDLLVGELGVTVEEIEADGAVSESVARRMAAAARIKYGAQVGVALTGFAAGYGKGSGKRDGTLYAAMDDGQAGKAKRFHMAGGRERITSWAVQSALDWLRRRLK